MKRPRQRRRKWWLYTLAALVLGGGYSYWALQRPSPLLQPVTTAKHLQTKKTSSQLSWPTTGQAAVGIVGSGILETHGKQTPAPIASVAKVITALAVLQAKPLQLSQQGPKITLTDQDVAFYHNYAAQDGSLLPVKAGEQISEYQMLQALMLPSANNIADTMAIWAYGSLDDYAAAANTYLKANGLADTHVGKDASGLSPTTTSTAEDLIKLGQLAMQQPVLAEIVSQPKATGIPQTTVVRNVNFLLGTAHIIGIKTGNTEQAGGVFLSASQIKINQKPVTIITAVVGEATLFTALKSSLVLVKSAQANFQPATILKANTVIGYYKVPWGSPIPALTSQDLTTTTWKGGQVKAVVDLKPVGLNDRSVGAVTLPESAITPQKSIPVMLKSQPSEPSAWWRLTHPF